ncbi:hypothetical protein [Neisseria montereyensis]|uniref:Uncharacterized protein n=1 Tax=Neisseria montereyensis TaxID=2973938 RepID=A0ABT2FD28_9NEIS|nr:hypothetical protein [Neisseria montereyensis]MCS4534010.1 hypothetical protein [Neisseria montereyensis]
MTAKTDTVHDGVSEIHISQSDLGKAFEELWTLLVPQEGFAPTLQGEVIRVSGRIAGEIYRNGGMNWYSGYDKLLRILTKYLHSENTFSDEEWEELSKLIKFIGRNGGKGTCFEEVETLSNYAVLWVKKNPHPIPLDKENIVYNF